MAMSMKQDDALRILYVDDIATNHAIFQSMFDFSGVEYEIAETCEKAVNLCLRNRYDLIIMDCFMDIFDGFLATKFIRNNERAEKLRPSVILGLVHHDDVMTRIRASMSGMNGMVGKPMTIDVFKKIINRWFDADKASEAGGVAENLDHDKQLNAAESYAAQFLDKDAALSLKDILKDKYPTTLELFKQDIKKYVELAYDGLDQQDLQRVHDSMHTIKSVSMQVGLIKVHELAAQLESICGNLDTGIEKNMLCDIVRAQVDHIQHVYSLSEKLLEQTK
ncbi:MAG: response regulator [Pseudomonadota bacterium]|nr:response regulator [Pseudomonadota bacterium]